MVAGAGGDGSTGSRWDGGVIEGPGKNAAAARSGGWATTQLKVAWSMNRSVLVLAVTVAIDCEG